MYTGLIYNDMFSKSLNVLGSHWKVTITELNLNITLHQLNPKGADYDQTPYPFGLDPVWQVNEFILNITIKIFGYNTFVLPTAGTSEQNHFPKCIQNENFYNIWCNSYVIWAHSRILQL